MAKSLKIDEKTQAISMSRQEWTDAICRIVGQMNDTAPLQNAVGGAFDTWVTDEEGRRYRLILTLAPDTV